MSKNTPSSNVPDVPHLRFGAAFSGEPRFGWEIGTVADYDAAKQTYTIVTGATSLYEVQMLKAGFGSEDALPMGCQVVVHRELGFPLIVGVLGGQQANVTDLIGARVSEVQGIGGENPLLAGGRGSARSPDAPKDMVGGDWVKRAPTGNLFAALNGGTNIMKSGVLSQIRTHQLGDLVEILSGNFRHITHMGDLEVHNKDGKCSMTWRAATDQMTETGDQNWTVRLDVGEAGDLFKLEVTTPQGQTLARYHISPDGQVEIQAADGFHTTSLTDASETVLGAKKINVSGAVTETIKGSKTTDVARDHTSTVGGDEQRAVSGTQTNSVGGHSGNLISGDETRITLGDGKYEFVNGGLEMVIGNPLKGGLPEGQTVRMVNYGGGYDFVVQPTAIPSGFRVFSPLPASVQLGCDGVAFVNPLTGKHQIIPVPAVFGVTMFEPLAALLAQLFLMFDTHIHGSAVGPTSPPVPPLMTSYLGASVGTLRSQRVSVGA